MSVVALDLFAGTGWGVACQRLGIEEYGVEIMPEARAVRALNGMRTIYGDVWEGLIDDLIESRDGYAREAADDMLARGFDPREVYDLLIASPPCQTFSMAGSGAGRRALDEVLAAIDERLYVDPEALRAFGDRHDPKTALVLAPLAHIYRDTPMYVVLEQVPPVLPVWERYAEEMRRWGYSVWTGNLQAEQYGVPQTRKRAILIARADGREAKAPTPTHSRYYSRDPKRLDEGVLPWVSMAEALGWGMTERPQFTVTSGGAATGGYEPFPTHAREAIAAQRERGAWVMRSNFSAGGAGTAEERGRTLRPAGEPPLTMTGKPGHWIGRQDESPLRWQGAEDGYTYVGDEATHDVVMLKRDEIRGTARVRIESSETLPVGAEVTVPLRRIAPRQYMSGASGTSTVQKPRHVAEPAHTITGAGIAEFHDRKEKATGSRDRAPGASRVTIEEAAALQSYPADFRWDATFVNERGREQQITKTNTFLQIGNAVPPGLAEAVLREVLS